MKKYEAVSVKRKRYVKESSNKD